MNQEVTELTKEWVIKRLPPRPESANKGTFGKVLVIAGSENYPGAAYLACAGAYRVGVGLVTLVTTETVQQIVGKKLPEVTFITLPARASFKEYDACLIGPGLGQSNQAVELIGGQVLNSNLSPTVIDGDGLNILSKKEEWWKKLNGEVILTPHPGEMARLTGTSVQKIQADRINVAQHFAKKWQQTLVLKGANTVIASHTGQLVLSPFANPTLATAGTGDILGGAIVGFLAQGLTPFDASSVGVYIHGQAGEMLREKIGDTGILSSDLLPILPLAIRHIRTADRLN